MIQAAICRLYLTFYLAIIFESEFRLPNKWKLLGGRGFLFELIDSGSSNGTFLNGRLTDGPTILKNGDLIEAGDCGLIFFTLYRTRQKKLA
jgi:pSer/pThr/pTyr-binding forkhead associated (FHA) protein